MRKPTPPLPHPALAWARCGAMALTGPARGTPRLAPGPLAPRAARAVARLAELSGSEALAALDGAALLGERAGALGLRRRGAVSPGGSCRLLRARDGWLALNLARPEDAALLPAWLEAEAAPGSEPWAYAAPRVAERRAGELLARAGLLGLPAARAALPGRPPAAPVGVALRGVPHPRRGTERPRVVDLSSLWAGPLCTHLLALAGARVTKVESTRRPDGARCGDPRLFDLWNAGKRSAALDLASPEGRAALARLVEAADIVVEASRPRALRQLGIDAEALVRRIPGSVWVSITGHGRAGTDADRVAFGDDAACAAGLAAATGTPEAPLFCGDAIADPLAGIQAALAAWEAWRAGGGVLLDISLARAAAWSAFAREPAPEGGPDARAGVQVLRRAGGHEVIAEGERAPVAPPRVRRPRGRARPLGADTAAVLREAGVPC